eukprot:gnl/TRDRNA2_/TRDRNA2_193703_c0_seq1.p1 gnl/TRDRNA2_/TRDRNA2_193703_c0~~gnl/TRDRNA2_/TRDRNA2_193703_c0_seq1.p1  ORF type:complete len:478 (+),score=97.46 gnl/TRDRNA2_/TRDRNA2_193703_c0_seq1:166-1599(+)
MPSVECYEVVHNVVAIRSEASTKAQALGAAKAGEFWRGETVLIHGEPWLRITDDKIADRGLPSSEGASAWMLIDGKSVGLGELLRLSVDHGERGKPLEVVIHIDREFGLSVEKVLTVGSTIADVKKALVLDDPTGQTSAEDLALSRLDANARPLRDSVKLSEALKELMLCAPGQAEEDDAVPEAPPANRGMELAKSYQGRCSHRLLADDAFDIRVLVTTATTGKWYALGGEADITITQEGQRCTLTDGMTSLEGTVDLEGVVQGAVQKSGESGGTFTLTPIRPAEYCIVQATQIKKLGADPAKGTLKKLTKKVGSTLSTTGRSWTGPKGGEWVEQAAAENPGWFLVEGQGFGVAGPLLRKLEQHESSSSYMVLRVEKPQANKANDEAMLDVREFAISCSAKVREIRQWIAWIFGLDPKKLMLGPPAPEGLKLDVEYEMKVDDWCSTPDKMLKDDAGAQESGYKSGDVVQFLYTGNLG